LMTAASLTYPLGSILDVFCPSTGREITVQVTDHGPYSRRFGIDLSESAFSLLGGAKNKGWVWVKVTPV
jgi:rare lipoprotein A